MDLYMDCIQQLTPVSNVTTQEATMPSLTSLQQALQLQVSMHRDGTLSTGVSRLPLLSAFRSAKQGKKSMTDNAAVGHQPLYVMDIVCLPCDYQCGEGTI